MYYFFVFLFFIISTISFAKANNNAKEVLKANYASVIMYHRFGDSRYPSKNNF